MFSSVPILGTLWGCSSEVARGTIIGAPTGLLVGFVGSSLILMNPPIFWQLIVLSIVLGANLGATAGILGKMISRRLEQRRSIRRIQHRESQLVR
jgi:hypothetical protein